jgi:glycosyltransferase involved in cell wall biosynthesis
VTCRAALRLLRAGASWAATVARALRAAVVPQHREAHGPLVSVIIATFDWSSVLRHAIASVQAQTHQDWELIVVGDGCSDDSEAVVTAIGRSDERVRWLGLPVNSGSQSSPNNAGIAAARGHWIAYLGHDDLWLPDHLERLVAAADRTGRRVAFALSAQIGPAGSDVLRIGPLRPVRDGSGVPPSALLHERSLVETAGGWRDFRELTLSPDYEFVRRLIATADRAARSDALTVLKFNSALRPGSYRDRRDDEQAAMLARLRTARRRTVVGLLARYAWMQARRVREQPAGFRPAPADAGPGWHVHEWRHIRGLPPLPGSQWSGTSGRQGPEGD